MRNTALSLLATLLILLSAAVASSQEEATPPPDPYAGYDAELPTEVKLRNEQENGHYRRLDFTYMSAPGVTVPVLAALPKQPGPWPAVVLLYGIGQSRTFLDDIAAPFADAGYALFVPEQHERGERKKRDLTALEYIFALRKRAFQNVIDTRRLIDVLQERPDIDTERIYFWGVSFGAMTGCATIEKEPRIKAAVLSLGAGDLPKVLTSNRIAQDHYGGLGEGLQPLLETLFGPAEPLDHIGNVTGRPLLFQNALKDELLPRECADALFEAAPGPKKRLWYDTGHVEVNEDEIVRMLLDGIQWLDGLAEPPEADEEG